MTTAKRYGNNFIKIQTMNVQRTPGTESPTKDEDSITPIVDVAECPFTGETSCVYDGTKILERLERKNKREESGEVTKMEESLIRSKRMVFEYAFSNDWDYFCTFTIDSEKYDRYALNEYHKKFSQWIRDFFRKKHGLNVQYVCIPEQHKDGAWHEHALISGIPLEHLREFKLTEKLPKYIRKKLKNNEKIYTCPAYEKKFGYCTFEPVRNSEACAKYITKYITKDLASSVSALNAKIYYVSRGLKKAEKIAVGHYQGVPLYDYSNIYCKSATFAYSEKFENIVKGKIIGLNE